jgi:hypothetical protein
VENNYNYIKLNNQMPFMLDNGKKEGHKEKEKYIIKMAVFSMDGFIKEWHNVKMVYLFIQAEKLITEEQ